MRLGDRSRMRLVVVRTSGFSGDPLNGLPFLRNAERGRLAILPHLRSGAGRECPAAAKNANRPCTGTHSSTHRSSGASRYRQRRKTSVSPLRKADAERCGRLLSMRQNPGPLTCPAVVMDGAVSVCGLGCPYWPLWHPRAVRSTSHSASPLAPGLTPGAC